MSPIGASNLGPRKGDGAEGLAWTADGAGHSAADPAVLPHLPAATPSPASLDPPRNPAARHGGHPLRTPVSPSSLVNHRNLSHAPAVNRRLATSLLGLALLAAGCASVRTVDLHADHPEAREQIERRLHEILTAAESKDFERLDRYHFYGPKFTRFSGGSPVIMDAAATRKAEHEGLGALEGLTMEVEGLKIDVFGTVGIAAFILNYSFASGDATVRRKERSTLVFVNERGDWRIAHEHLSSMTLAEPDDPESGSRTIRSETNGASWAAGSRR